MAVAETAVREVYGRTGQATQSLKVLNFNLYSFIHHTRARTFSQHCGHLVNSC